jgi:hypothetical protein
MTVVDTALEYNTLGWSVTRLAPGEKKATRTWERWQSQKQTPANVRSIFRDGDKPRVPKYGGDARAVGIAIITGAISNLVVVDVDTYHGGSTDGLPPTGVIAKTGRGGLQYFYKHPGRHVDNRVGVRPGIDVRGDGGYVAAVPTDTTGHPDGGGPYSWIAFDPDALGDAPAWALEEAAATVQDETPQQEKWVTHLLLHGAPEGERNKSLVRLAGYYASKGFPLDVALVDLGRWADNLPGSPMETDEVQTTIRSAFKAERRRNRSRGVVEENPELLPMTALDDYMLKHGGVMTQWTVKHWLPSSTIAMLVSPPQSFKTWTAFDLAVSVASGAPFLGQYPVLEPGPVAIFQQEDPHSNIAERMALISIMRSGMPPMAIEETEDGETVFTIPMLGAGDLPIYYHEERRLRFDDAAVMDALEGFVAKVKPRLVIIDPLYSAADTEDYMAKAAQQMMRLKDIRDKHGTSFIIVHHSSKGEASWDREKIWGSQFLNAFVETSWLMRGAVNDTWTVLLRHFKTEGPQPFVRLNFDIQSADIPWRYEVGAEEISAEEADKVIQRDVKVTAVTEKPNAVEARVLKVLRFQGASTSQQLAKAAKVAKEDVEKSLKSLLHKHRVRQDAAQRWEPLNLDDDSETV